MPQLAYRVEAYFYAYYDGKNLEPVKEYIAKLTKDDDREDPHIWLEMNDGKLMLGSIGPTGDPFWEKLPPDSYIVNEQVLTAAEFHSSFLLHDPRVATKLAD